MIQRNRRNTLYSKVISYDVVEEYLDAYFDNDPTPISFTTARKKCVTHFQVNKEWTGKSIYDAVQTYYSSHFGSSAAVRNMCIAMSNNTRNVSDETRRKMSKSAIGNQNARKYC